MFTTSNTRETFTYQQPKQKTIVRNMPKATLLTSSCCLRQQLRIYSTSRSNAAPLSHNNLPREYNESKISGGVLRT